MSLRGTLPSSSMISAIWSIQQTVARKKDRQDKQIHQTVDPVTGPLWVCGWRAEGERGLGDVTHTSLTVGRGRGVKPEVRKL